MDLVNQLHQFHLYNLLQDYLDQDIDRFDFYIGRTEDSLVKEQEGLKDEQITLTLDNGITYFWQVVTFDSENNASKSQIFSFQTVD